MVSTVELFASAPPVPLKLLVATMVQLPAPGPFKDTLPVAALTVHTVGVLDE